MYILEILILAMIYSTAFDSDDECHQIEDMIHTIVLNVILSSLVSLVE